MYGEPYVLDLFYFSEKELTKKVKPEVKPLEIKEAKKVKVTKTIEIKSKVVNPIEKVNIDIIAAISKNEEKEIIFKVNGDIMKYKNGIIHPKHDTSLVTKLHQMSINFININ